MKRTSILAFAIAYALVAVLVVAYLYLTASWGPEELYYALFALLLPSSIAVLPVSAIAASHFHFLVGSLEHVVGVCAVCVPINSVIVGAVVWALSEAFSAKSRSAR